MEGREYLWTDEGAADADARGLSQDEVVQALYAPAGLRYEHRIGDVVLVVSMIDSGMVLAVFCEQRIKGISQYYIMAALPVTGANLDEWRRRVL